MKILYHASATDYSTPVLERISKCYILGPMNNLRFVVTGLIAVVIIFTAPFAFANEAEPADDRGSDKSVEVTSNMPVPGTTGVKEMEVYADDDGAMSVGEEHRSEVAKAVQGLLDAADRAGGIGEEVRAVAEEQKSLHDEAADAMEKVEKRNGLMTFLFGSDYKNLGALRSAITTSENGIDRLTKAGEKATASVKAELDAQITALKAENDHARSFIEEQEGKFSLFGWLVKFLSE
jgi:hypothetical protein